MNNNILICGAGSYIGGSFAEYVSAIEGYRTETLDMQNEAWRSFDFSGFDTVYFVAGIAHIKETAENAGLYYKVNRDLALECAEKAKKAGVKHFIYLSTMNVYGLSAGRITASSPVNPKSNYGKSKLEAEAGLKSLGDDGFAVSVLRPPMVYGKGCRGNYNSLASLAKKTPFFPRLKNERSMIYIDNLSSFVKHIIDNRMTGVMFPQNAEYICTSDMVRDIAACNGKKVRLVPGFAHILTAVGINTFQKVFGSLTYDAEMSPDRGSYCVVSYKDSIAATEK